MSVAKVLKETNNYPDFDFFVQIGGDASGEVLNNTQLNRRATGSASITIYSKMKHAPIILMRRWAKFFKNESCGQCTPCREGTLRLVYLLNAKEIDWEMCGDILDNLKETSFCALGTAVPVAIKSYAKNVLANMPKDKPVFSGVSNEFVCKCLR
jgi:NADH:ubiquinone oxidoreductase subunit F (NADH-binding)